MGSRHQRAIRWSDEVYRIYGVEPGRFEVTHESFIAMVHPDDRERLEDSVRTGTDRRRFFEVEHRIVRPDGVQRDGRRPGAGPSATPTAVRCGC